MIDAWLTEYISAKLPSIPFGCRISRLQSIDWHRKAQSASPTMARSASTLMSMSQNLAPVS